jgi:hypothetical protein
LSVGVAKVSSQEYQAIYSLFENSGYTPDKDMKYRLYPPRKNRPGAVAYVDLLAHSAHSKISDSHARKQMGVEESFSLKAMSFARREAFEIIPNVYFPNPLGFLRLKAESYQDEPNRRSKDLADIAELVHGLVEKGFHFDIDSLWKKVCRESDAATLRTVLQNLGDQNSTSWDLDHVSSDLLQRGFSENDIDDVIPQRFLELVNCLKLP